MALGLFMSMTHFGLFLLYIKLTCFFFLYSSSLKGMVDVAAKPQNSAKYENSLSFI